MDVKLYASLFVVLIDEKTSKWLKDKVCGSYPIKSIRIPSSETFS